MSVEIRYDNRINKEALEKALATDKIISVAAGVVSIGALSSAFYNPFIGLGATAAAMTVGYLARREATKNQEKLSIIDPTVHPVDFNEGEEEPSSQPQNL